MSNDKVVHLNKHKYKDLDPDVAETVYVNTTIMSQIYTTLMWTEFYPKAHLITVREMLDDIDNLLNEYPELQNVTLSIDSYPSVSNIISDLTQRILKKTSGK